MGSTIVENAIAFMERGLAESLTLSQVCAAVGVCPRTLQKAFQGELGCTPMHWLRQRRLAVARARLLAARNGETVTDIVSSTGITHLGRFSVEYRRRYGVTPSSTLPTTTTSH